MLLRVCNLSKRFGGVIALDSVTAEFHPGSITALVGSNGAGKSTLFNVIGGLVVPDTGEVVISDGEEVRLTGLPPHAIARRGVGMLFQDVRVFRKLSALENVAVGFAAQPGERPLYWLLHRGAARRREREVLEQAMQYLEFVGLSDKAQFWGERLSYGQQKLLAIARLLAGDARTLLLDEPTSGVHPDRIGHLLDRIQRLTNDQGRTVIMIEHNREIVANISDRVYQLEAGRIVASGTPCEVLTTVAPTLTPTLVVST